VLLFFWYFCVAVSIVYAAETAVGKETEKSKILTLTVIYNTKPLYITMYIILFEMNYQHVRYI